MKRFPFRLLLAAILLAALAPVPALCHAMKHPRKGTAGKHGRHHKHQGAQPMPEKDAEQPAN
jgi:hypothetical protein